MQNAQSGEMPLCVIVHIRVDVYDILEIANPSAIYENILKGNVK